MSMLAFSHLLGQRSNDFHDFGELVFREKFDFEPFKPSMSCYMQIMQIRMMLTKCSASKLTYLFILKQ